MSKTYITVFAGIFTNVGSIAYYAISDPLDPLIENFGEAYHTKRFKHLEQLLCCRDNHRSGNNHDYTNELILSSISKHYEDFAEGRSQLALFVHPSVGIPLQIFRYNRKLVTYCTYMVPIKLLEHEYEHFKAQRVLRELNT